MRKIFIFAIMTMMIIPAFILSGCGSGETDEISSAENGRYSGNEPRIQNLIFYGTWEMQLEMTKNVPEPLFAWDSTGMEYVIITVFDSRVDIKDNQIANPEAAVWTWNTGMGRGREGNVAFSDGRDVKNGEIQDTVTSLSPGTYFVAAWAYDYEYNLFYSSKEYMYSYSP